MNKEHPYTVMVLMILGTVSSFVGSQGYISKYLVDSRGLCPTGGTGGFYTMGLYNCYTALDKYLIWTGYLFLIIAVLILGLALRKKV